MIQQTNKNAVHFSRLFIRLYIVHRWLLLEEHLSTSSLEREGSNARYRPQTKRHTSCKY